MKALLGKRILVTRPRAQAEGLLEQLAQNGAIALPFPVIRIEPLQDFSVLDRAIRALDSYSWVIFTSANGVSAFWERLEATGQVNVFQGGPRLAAIGPVTARALEERGVRPDCMPAEYIAEAIVAELGDIQGLHILLPRAEIARPALTLELSQGGAFPDEVAVYKTVLEQPDPEMLEELKRGVDAITFTSSSTVKSFHQIQLDEAIQLKSGTTIACIGPITAQTAAECGYAVDIVAETFTGSGLVEALERYYLRKAQEPSK